MPKRCSAALAWAKGNTRTTSKAISVLRMSALLLQLRNVWIDRIRQELVAGGEVGRHLAIAAPGRHAGANGLVQPLERRAAGERPQQVHALSRRQQLDGEDAPR